MRIEDEIKGRFRNEYYKGFINLRYTTNLLSYEMLKAFRRYGITEPQYNVLRILRGFRSEAPLSIGFVKERMLDKVSDVSRIVDRLVEKRLVTRVENSEDRRQKSIEITPAGLDLLGSMLECEKKTDNLLANLEPDEVKELNRLLDKARG
jgi:DNA-binding MarR family transcriptional regulator